MIERSRRPHWPRLVAGLVIVVVGLAFLTDLGAIFGTYGFSKLWPLIVIVLGVLRLADAGDAERRRGALVLTFIGGWLLIASLGLFGLDYGDSWPLVFVAIGLAILLSARGGRDTAKGVFLILVGGLLLITLHDYLGFGVRLAWPLVIVLFGLWLAVSAFFGRDEGDSRPESESASPER